MADRPPPVTLHVIRAAVHVAAILGHSDAPIAVARESYWRRATGGVYSPEDLQRGEDLLVSAGMLIRNDDYLTRTPQLTEIGGQDDVAAAGALVAKLVRAGAFDGPPADAEAALEALIEDPERREALLLALGQRFDDAVRREVGSIGEELVVAHARRELEELGRPDLAKGVRRVSLLSDQLGYDIAAPRVAAPVRLLEVKATAGQSGQIFLSRNEADTGTRFQDWALVICEVTDLKDRTGSILGWCSASAIAAMLPRDGPGSRWQSASMEVDLLPLLPGVPRPTA